MSYFNNFVFAVYVQYYNYLSLLVASNGYICCNLILHSTTEPDCERAIDIMLVLDFSSSVGISNFNTVKQFLIDLVGHYEIGSNTVRFGAIQYSTLASVVIPLGAHSDLLSLQNAINGIDYLPGSTNTGDAIKLATQQFSINGRPGVPKVCIKLTDGESNDLAATTVAARDAQNTGIEIFAIGIGRSVTQQELNIIASDPDITHVFEVVDFDMASFDDILSTLVRNTCSGKIILHCIHV